MCSLPLLLSQSSYEKVVLIFKHFQDDNSGMGEVLCMSRNAIKPGMCVLIIDDIIATGGTMMTAVSLVKAQVSHHCCFS